jgi:hypothetical protein
MKRLLPLIAILFLCSTAHAQVSKTYVPHGTGAPSVCPLGTVYVDDSTGNVYANRLGACQIVGSVTGSGASGRVTFWSSASALSSDSTFTFSSGTLGVTQVGVGLGSVAPPTALTVGDTSSSTPRGLMSWQSSNDTSSAHLHMRKSRGTFATPLTIVTGDVLGRVVFAGYDGSTYNESAYIRAVSTGTIGSTRVPSKLELFTSTDAAPSVATLALTIDETQKATFAGHLAVEGVTSTGATGTGKFVFNISPALAPAANASALTSTGYSLTGSNAQSMIDLSGTLNTSGSPDIFAMRITDTARGGTTNWLNLYGGASGTTSIFQINRIGLIKIPGGGNVIFANSNSADISTYARFRNTYFGEDSTTGGFWTGGLAGASFFGSGNSNPLQFVTSSIVRETIFTGGNVAVGSTTDNGQKFQVAGSASAYGSVVTGTAFTVSGCSNGSPTGGATAGTFLSGTTGTCSVTVTMGNSFTAPNGFSCFANNQTTLGNIFQQTGGTTTTATFSGTTVSGDKINFKCDAY